MYIAFEVTCVVYDTVNLVVLHYITDIVCNKLYAFQMNFYRIRRLI